MRPIAGIAQLVEHNLAKVGVQSFPEGFKSLVKTAQYAGIARITLPKIREFESRFPLQIQKALIERLGLFLVDFIIFLKILLPL